MKFQKRDQASNTGSSDYMRIKPGESKIGVLRGEIFEFHILWLEGKSQVVAANHPDGKIRFKVNFFVREGTELVPKIWEFGIVIYNQLADIASEYEITTTPIKVTRQGSGTDTTYMVLPILKTPLTPKQIATMEATPLHILGKAPVVKSEEYPKSWDPEVPDSDESLEF